MGRPIDLNSTVVNMANIARISNIQHQKDETQQRLFNMALKEETIRKETQVQTEHKVEPAIIQVKPEKEENKQQKKRQKGHENQQSKDEQHNDDEEKDHHIDIKV